MTPASRNMLLIMFPKTGNDLRVYYNARFSIVLRDRFVGKGFLILCNATATYRTPASKQGIYN